MATIDIKTLATELNTDARTARKFLRSVTPADAQPGKGSRWAIEKVAVRSLKSKFSKFEAANEAEKLARAAASDAPKLTLTKTEIQDPTDADLEMIDAEIDLDQE